MTDESELLIERFTLDEDEIVAYIRYVRDHHDVAFYGPSTVRVSRYESNYSMTRKYAWQSTADQLKTEWEMAVVVPFHTKDGVKFDVGIYD